MRMGAQKGLTLRAAQSGVQAPSCPYQSCNPLRTLPWLSPKHRPLLPAAQDRGERHVSGFGGTGAAPPSCLYHILSSRKWANALRGGAVCRQGQLHRLVASEERPGAAGPPPAKEMHSFQRFCMQGGSEAAQSNTHLEVSTVACVQGLEEPFRAGHGAAHLPPWPVRQRVRSPPTARLLHRGSPGISLIS